MNAQAIASTRPRRGLGLISSSHPLSRRSLPQHKRHRPEQGNHLEADREYRQQQGRVICGSKTSVRKDAMPAKGRKVGVSRKKIAFMAARFRRPDRAPESEDSGVQGVRGLSPEADRGLRVGDAPVRELRMRFFERGDREKKDLKEREIFGILDAEDYISIISLDWGNELAGLGKVAASSTACLAAQYSRIPLEVLE
jgi:hypothetical protein